MAPHEMVPMTVRPPQNLGGPLRPETGFNVLEYEIAQQKAQTLGDLGQKLEEALSRLRSFDPAQAGPDGAARQAALLDAAAERAWSLMVQRELSGLRHWDAVVKSYAIPREVLNRMGRVTR